MKKNLFLLGLAVAAMTSCTNDEVVEVNQSTQKAIGFESFVNKDTRAVDVNSLQRFYVHGYYGDTETNVFNDVEVIKNGVLWKMLESNMQNWQVQHYYFAAYANDNGLADNNNNEVIDDNDYITSDLVTSFEDGTLTITDYEVDTDQNSQLDLVAALAERDNSEGNVFNVASVPLTFSHMLSKVNFQFQNTSTEADLTMDVSNVKLTIKNIGTCAYGTNGIQWTTLKNSAGFTGYDLNIPTPTGIQNQHYSGFSGEYYVIPQGVNDASISYTVTFKNSQGVEVDTYTEAGLSLFTAADRTTVTWTPGYIYNYTVQLPASPKPITFTVVGVDNWTTQNVTLDGNLND